MSQFFNSRLWIFLLSIMFILIAYYISRIDTLILSDNHIDGFFQTYNGLFRIAKGERVGVDFFLYLGPGVYYTMMPLYLWFGNDLSASILASDFIVSLIGFLIALILLKSLKIKNDIFYPLSILLALILVIVRIDILEPGNSLKSLRDLPSYLPAFIFLFIYSKYLEKKILLMGFTMGLLTVFSPASSVASTIIYSFFIFFVLINNFRDQMIKKILLIGLSFIAGLSVWFFYDKDGLFGNLGYMFIDISQNQKWFFPAYNDSYLIFSLYFKKYILLISILICIFMRKKTIESFLIIATSSSLFLTGIISTLKGHFYISYFHMFDFFSSIYIILFIISLIFDKYEYKFNKNIFIQRIQKNKSVYINLSVCVILICTFTCVYIEYDHKRKSLDRDQRFIFISELGGFIDKKNQKTIEYIRKNKDLIFLEEYSGIPMAIVKQKPITNVDSIIHAMGRKRDSFHKNIKEDKIDIITSTNPESSPWMNWNMAQNWYFYKNLFINYEIDYKGYRILFWKKSKINNLASIKKVNCEINDENKSITINNGNNGFYSIDINYKLKDKSLLLVDVNLYTLSIRRLSLPPHLNRFEFPSKKGNIYFETIPKIAKGGLTLVSCSAEDFTLVVDKLSNHFSL